MMLNVVVLLEIQKKFCNRTCLSLLSRGRLGNCIGTTLIKKKTNFPHIGKFRVELLQSHI